MPLSNTRRTTIEDRLLAPTRGAPIENRLLAALPKKDYNRIIVHLERVELPFAMVLYEPGDIIHHVYFPNAGIVSLLSTVEDRSTLEVGIIGNEGMVGLSLLLGVTTSPNRALVQGEGSAMRMKAAAFRKFASEGGPLQRLLHRHIHALMTQISQSAACNRFHHVEARLARWLLMTQDRMGSAKFRLTQQFLSDMLGVRREGVTYAAKGIQRKKLVTYSRGHLTVLNREGLEAAACKCYGVIKAEYDSFLGD